MDLADPGLLRAQAYIDGQWVDADSGEIFAVENPATGEVLAEVACCGGTETSRAIEAAGRAFEKWRHTTAKERAAMLRRWFDLMMESQEDLARMMTAEQGKPLFEARGEITYGASYVEWFAEEAKRVYGDTIPQP
ncbi:MAG: aldehyde dehydrogenase family protein, partial [Acidobacteria bacterium]|nr:aldehyde dehydrogenase family protein [Acidobacteriota bacterium]